MNNLNIVLIEDEKPAARLLAAMIGRLRPQWIINVIDGSVSKAIKWFEENNEPDLMFLDIQLSDGNSFLFLEKSKPLCPIIFTTAYDEFAIRAFSVNSIDYLLKPFDQKRLEESIIKFESLNLNEYCADNIIETIKSMVYKEKKYRTRFLVSGFGKFETLQVEEIAYFYSVNRISFAVLKNSHEQIIDFSLDKLSDQLDPDRFFRVNRQFILNIDSIKKIEPYFGNKFIITVMPASKEKITVSKEKVSQFKRWLNF